MYLGLVQFSLRTVKNYKHLGWNKKIQRYYHLDFYVPLGFYFLIAIM